MLAGLLIGAALRSVVNQFYDLLHGIFPETFPFYNTVLEKNLQERLETRLNLISLALTLVLTVIISQRLNNDRYEYIISKTDGIYKIDAVLPTYVSNFALSDLISSIIVGAAYTVPVAFIPKQFFGDGSLVGELLYIMRVPTEAYGTVLGSILVVLILSASHFATLSITLRYYRAKWLSGFAEA